MSYSREHAIAFCTVFTRDQLACVVEFIRSSPSPQGEIAARKTGLSFAPPLLACADAGSALEPIDYENIFSFMTYVNAAALQRPWDVAAFAAIFELGAGLNSDYARQLAIGCVTPDSDVSGFSWRVLNALADLPFIPDGPIRAMLLEVGDRAAATLYDYMSTNGSHDTLYEWMRAGAAMREASKRELLRAQEAAYEMRALGRGRPDARIMGRATPSTAPGLTDLLGGLLGSGSTEGGDAFETGDSHEMNRSELSDRLNRAPIARTGYHSYIERGDPEQGFLPLIMSAVGGIGSMVGSMFGGGGGGGGSSASPPASRPASVASTSKTRGGRAFSSMRRSATETRTSPTASSILETVFSMIGGGGGS